MKASERSRLHFVESQAKRYKWRSVALVGVCDTGLARQFLAHFPRCKVFVVPVWREDLRPGPAGAQRHFQRNLRIWEKSYGGRFDVDEGNPIEVAKRFGPQFDGVVLWEGIPAQLLAVVGAAWTPRVVSGGWVLGLDHRQGYTREVLDQVAPGWVHYREGIWGVRVRREADAPEVDVVVVPAVDHSPDKAEEGHVGPVLHDSASSDAGPIRPPVGSGDFVDPGNDVDPVDEGGSGRESSGDERVFGPASLSTPKGADELFKPGMGRILSVEEATPNPTPVSRGYAQVISPDVDAAPVAQKRRGGRPKGSKNKPKVAPA